MGAIRFTGHAFFKVAERLTLTREEIASLITIELTIPLGYERGTNRIHLLFYSNKDQECFVIIFDEKTQEVITVLPTNYHNRWVIDTRLLVAAKEIILTGKKFGVSAELEKRISRLGGKKEGIKGKSKSPKQTVEQIAPYFYIHIFFRRNGKSQIEVFKWSSYDYVGDLGLLKADERFCEELQKNLARKLEEGCIIERIRVKLGRRGKFTPLVAPIFIGNV